MGSAWGILAVVFRFSFTLLLLVGVACGGSSSGVGGDGAVVDGTAADGSAFDGTVQDGALHDGSIAGDSGTTDGEVLDTGVADGSFGDAGRADGGAHDARVTDGGSSRARNGHNCVELMQSGVSITVDGNFSDWNGVLASGTIEDAPSDYTGTDNGADIQSLKVEVTANWVYVHLELYHPPSQDFQARLGHGGQYRLFIQNLDGTLTVQTVSRVAYSDTMMAWQMLEPWMAGSLVEFAVGAEGIEWAFDTRLLKGTHVTVIRAEVLLCTGMGPCGVLDATDECGYFPGI